MTKSIAAIYEKGVLRPLQPLTLAEHQQVRLSITVQSNEEALEGLIDHEYLAQIDSIDEPEPTLEEVRKALAKVPGKLSDDIRAERDARG